MFKITNAIKCVNCRELLETPVILPCSHSVCKKHTTIEAASICCLKCGEEHVQPTNGNGFLLNEALAEIIEAQLGSLEFGTEHYNHAKQSCQDLDDLLTKIERLLHDPFNFTYEAIEFFKNVVQLKGEEAKLRIDEEMTRLIDSLNKYKSECKDNLETREYLREMGRFESEIEASRQNLEMWLCKLDEFNEEGWKKIKRESEKAIRMFETNLAQFKIDLLLQKRFWEYRAEIEQAFGKFELETEYNFG